VRAFCEALGITNPIVLGASFGGMVALAYATRNPAHPSKLVLISTEAAGDTYLDRRVALFGAFRRPRGWRAAGFWTSTARGIAVVPDAPERAMAVIRDFIGLPKTKPAPEGAGDEISGSANS
jgi:pimeloyl-ACP methyl ester carboxylesterase